MKHRVKLYFIKRQNKSQKIISRPGIWKPNLSVPEPKSTTKQRHQRNTQKNEGFSRSTYPHPLLITSSTPFSSPIIMLSYKNTPEFHALATKRDDFLYLTHMIINIQNIHTHTHSLESGIECLSPRPPRARAIFFIHLHAERFSWLLPTEPHANDLTIHLVNTHTH